MTDIAKLIVRMEAENAKLTKALEKSSRDLRRFEGQAKKSFNAVRSTANAAFAGISIGVLAVGLKSAVSATLDANDKLAKMAQSTGIAVEELHGLNLAAELAGVSIDTIAKGTGRLQRNMFDAVAGLKESKDSFDALGVSVQDSDGKLRDTQDVILELADKFSKIEDGAGKAALAQRLFGRAGADLIPLLNQGAEGIQKFIDEQKKLGNVLTAEVAAASERVNDNFTKLATAADGVRRSITTGMLPALEDITTELVNMAYGTNEASESFGKFIGDLSRVGVSSVIIISDAFSILGDRIGQVAAALVAVAQGDFKRAYGIITDDTQSLIDRVSDSFTSIENIWNGVANDILSTAPSTSEKIASPVVLAAAKVKTATQSIKDDMDLALDKISAGFDKLNAGAIDQLAGIKDPQFEANLRVRTIADQEDPTREIQRNIEDLRDFLDKGTDPNSGADFILSQESADIVSERILTMEGELDDSMNAVVSKSAKTSDDVSQFWIAAARSMESAMSDQFFNVMQGNFDSMASQFKATIDRMVADLLASQLLDAVKSSFSTGGAGASLIAAFTPKASGGPVAANQPYLVGEKGPELFIPQRSGAIMPNNALSGGIIVNQYVSTPDVNSFRHNSRQLAQDQSRLLGQARAMS